jgi:hypothetical protein
MPYAVSDMTATTFQDDVFSDDNGPRIYINGGCVSNQLCDLTDPSAGLSGGLFCYCTEITDRCLYFTPETDTWFTCTSAPRKRYRHMGEYERQIWTLYIYIQCCICCCRNAI